MVVRALQLLAYWPFAYVACALLRHVDTPVPSGGDTLTVVVYTIMPFLAVHYLLELVWCIWGEHSHPMIYAITDHELHQYQLLCLGVSDKA